MKRLADYVFEGPHSGWLPGAIIVGAVLVWALILDGTIGLEALRRLLGWTLY